jgi:hypothetical protein
MPLPQERDLSREEAALLLEAADKLRAMAKKYNDPVDRDYMHGIRIAASALVTRVERKVWLT